MFASKLTAAVAVIAAFILVPPIASAASPHAAHRGVAQAQPWLDWGNSFIDASGDTVKNEISIESIEPAAVFSGDAYDNEMGLRLARWLPEVDDEVL